MLELRKKIPQHSIYARICKIQEECLATKDEAANILAVDLGIPVYNFLSEPELSRLRELRNTRRMPTLRPQEKPEKEIRLETKIEETPITPSKLYDLLELHPRIVKASKSQFKSAHYADAIFNAFKCIEILAQEKSELDETGVKLMFRLFNEKKPIIKLNKMQRSYETDEQAGFKFIYAGAMLGIRNPKAHADIQQKNPYRTLEYLSFASLLARRLIEGEKASE
jgi:uncharacterized protein (TIGR02391 family)